jgi:hypothetical protein
MHNVNISKSVVGSSFPVKFDYYNKEENYENYR